MTSANHYSGAERTFLTLHYPLEGAAWCAARMPGRTAQAISTKATFMRLKLTPEARARLRAEAKAKASLEPVRLAEAEEKPGLPAEYLQAPSIWRVAQRFASDGVWLKTPQESA